MFETLLIGSNGKTTKCMVYPIDGQADLGVVFPIGVMRVTHKVSVQGTVGDARMLISVSSVADGKEHFIDPFEFRWNSSGNLDCLGCLIGDNDQSNFCSCCLMTAQVPHMMQVLTGRLSFNRVAIGSELSSLVTHFVC